MALRRSTAPATAPATPQTSLLPLEEEEGSGYCDKRSFFGARMSGRGLAVAAILVTVQLIFGGYAIVVKLALNDSVDALVFSLYRDLGASVVLGGACLLMGERKPVPPSDRLLFLGVGFFGITITQTAMVVALQYVPAFNASLMQPSQPVLTLLLALLLRMETLRLRSAAGSLKVLGILIGCAGATYTVLSAAHTKDETSEPAHPAGVSGILFGNALLVLQCVGGAIFQLLNKQLTGRYPSITVAAYGYCIGTVMLLVIVLPMRVSTPAAWGLPAAGFAALSYAVILASAFNYFAYAWAARRSNASTVTAFFPLQVVFAAILQAGAGALPGRAGSSNVPGPHLLRPTPLSWQVLILGEYPTPEQLVGAAAIVVALFCIVASLASDSGVESPKASSADAAAVVAEAESPEE